MTIAMVKITNNNKGMDDYNNNVNNNKSKKENKTNKTIKS